MNHQDKAQAIRLLTNLLETLKRRGAKASHFRAEVRHHTVEYPDEGGFMKTASGNMAVTLSVEIAVPRKRRRT